MQSPPTKPPQIISQIQGGWRPPWPSIHSPWLAMLAPSHAWLQACLASVRLEGEQLCSSQNFPPTAETQKAAHCWEHASLAFGQDTGLSLGFGCCGSEQEDSLLFLSSPPPPPPPHFAHAFLFSHLNTLLFQLKGWRAATYTL